MCIKRLEAMCFFLLLHSNPLSEEETFMRHSLAQSEKQFASGTQLLVHYIALLRHERGKAEQYIEKQVQCSLSCYSAWSHVQKTQYLIKSTRGDLLESTVSFRAATGRCPCLIPRLVMIALKHVHNIERNEFTAS